MKFKNLIVILALALLIVSNFPVNAPGQDSKESTLQNHARKVVGPKQLLKNTGFSTYGANWVFTNAKSASGNHIEIDYDDLLTPQYVKLFSNAPIDNNPVIYNAYINQSFYKPYWTPNYISALYCTFNWDMVVYTADVNSAPFMCEIYIQIINTSLPNNIGEWGVASGAGAITPTDARIGVRQYENISVGSHPGLFTFVPPGFYTLAVMYHICIPTGSSVVFELDLRIDNVTLWIADCYEPIVISTNNSFGPFNADPVGVIDVDFFSGGGVNTTLKEAKFRLNNSGTPGPWNRIFRWDGHLPFLNSYTQNFSITPVWDSLVEGVNKLDLYCIDELGNYYESVQISVAKDTIAPVTNALELNKYYTVREFNISYTGYDPKPSGGFNNSVELWFRHNKTGDFKKFLPSNNPGGWFNHSPILFNLSQAGSGYGVGFYEFYTRGIDNATNYEQPPGLDTATNITVFKESNPPTPKIIKPDKKYNKGNVTIIVESDLDTEFLELYYWLDKNNDTIANYEDGSNWVLIENVSIENKTTYGQWTTVWDTLSNADFSQQEQLIILKVIAIDENNNIGEGFKDDIEIDNVPPKVNITFVDPDFRNNNDHVTIFYTTDTDVTYANFFYRERDERFWRTIDTGVTHEYGTTNGFYEWKLSQKLIGEFVMIDVKIGVFDDAGNTGEDVYLGIIPPDVDWPIIIDTFPDVVELNEDFGTWYETLTVFEYHPNEDISDVQLNWYVTGNSGTIFNITGNNISGEIKDTFYFTSIPNKFGEEILTFHLFDPNGLEDTAKQRVIVNPINDPPGPAIITYPNNDPQIKIGTALNFSGTCDDPDLVTGDKLTFKWYSDISGEFGTGQNLSMISLVIGNHIITLNVIDMANETAADSISIVVYETFPPGEYNDTNETSDDNDTKKGTELNNLIVFIAILITVILILIVLFILIKKRKKISPTNENKQQFASRLPATPIKRQQAQKMSERVFSSYSTTNHQELIQTNVPPEKIPVAQPQPIKPTYQQIYTNLEKPLLPPPENNN